MANFFRHVPLQHLLGVTGLAVAVAGTQYLLRQLRNRADLAEVPGHQHLEPADDAERHLEVILDEVLDENIGLAQMTQEISPVFCGPVVEVRRLSEECQPAARCTTFRSSKRITCDMLVIHAMLERSTSISGDTVQLWVRKTKEISELSPEGFPLCTEIVQEITVVKLDAGKLQQYLSCCILEVTKCAPFHHHVQADTFLGLDGLMSAEWDKAQTDVQPTGDHVDDWQTVLSLPAMSLAAQIAVKVVLSVDGHFAARDAQGVTEHMIRSVPGDIYDSLKINKWEAFHLMLVSPSNVPRRQSLPGPSYLLVSDQDDEKILQCELPVTPIPESDNQLDTTKEEENQASNSDKEPTPPTNQPPPGYAPRRRRKGPPFFLRFLPKYRRIGVTKENLQNGSPEVELVASPKQTFSPTFLGSARSRQNGAPSPVSPVDDVCTSSATRKQPSRPRIFTRLRRALSKHLCCLK